MDSDHVKIEVKKCEIENKKPVSISKTLPIITSPKDRKSSAVHTKTSPKGKE